MKNIFKQLMAVVAMPAAVTSTLFTVNISPSKGIEPKKMARPYIVDVVDASGNQTSELKGTSYSIDPSQISKDLGASPFPEDKYAAFPSITMGIGSKITLYQAPLYYVQDGKKKYELRSWQKNVGDLLNEKNIPEIGVDDKINFATDVELENNMSIVINRVAKTTVVEPESIDFKVTKKSNPNLEKGTKNVLQAGKKGTKNKYYLVTREDGVEVSRALQKSEVVTEPTEEIDEVGTKVTVYGSGAASWYVSTNAMIGACNLVPKGTKLHVVNTANGKSVDITSSGGGGFSGMGRVVDLSTAAFEALGAPTSQGTIPNVRVEKYYPSN